MTRRFPRRLATLLALILAGLLAPGAAASATPTPTDPPSGVREGRYCGEQARYTYERAANGTWLQCLPLVTSEVYKWAASAGPGRSTPPPLRTDSASPGQAFGTAAALLALLAGGGALLLTGRQRAEFR
jgi:hypothetical protein